MGYRVFDLAAQIMTHARSGWRVICLSAICGSICASLLRQDREQHSYIGCARLAGSFSVDHQKSAQDKHQEQMQLQPQNAVNNSVSTLKSDPDTEPFPDYGNYECQGLRA